MGRPPRARARWRAGSPRITACPISTPAFSTAWSPAPCSMPASPLDDADAAAASATSFDDTTIDESRLRGREIGEAASVVAAIPAVRRALIDRQRRFARGGLRSRARRPRHRHGDLPRRHGEALRHRDSGSPRRAPAQGTGGAGARPRRSTAFWPISAAATPGDSGRGDAPLKAAEDAVQLDTSALGVEEAFQAALAIVESRKRG
jgi:cytidylate kinase